MAQHAILRFEKHKGNPARPLEAHHERQKEQYASNPDIDTSRSKYNFHIVKPEGRYYHFIQSRIEQAGCRTRKDSTRFVDTLITASPEFFKGKSPKEIQAFFQRASDFLIGRVGRENIVSAVVHMDEKTPHLHLTFGPLTKDNRLCAKEIIGNRANLTKWQDDFHAYMVVKYPDLERGESASKTGRKHIPTRLFKQAVSLSKQARAIEAALDGINPLNAGKKKEEALSMLKKWFPQMENFSGQLKKYKVTINDLLAENEKLEARAKASEKGKMKDTMERAKLKSELDNLQRLVDRTLPKEEHKTRDIWTAEVLLKALEACDDDILRLAINLAFSCSLRMGELLGLTWDCVDISPASIELGQASIFVEKELQRVNREAMADLNGKDIMFKFPPTFASTHTALVLKTPKTKTSVRKVFLPKTVAEMLVQRKADIEELKDLFGDEFVDFNLVFCSSNGKPIEGQVINRAFNKLIEENGLPKVVFHSLRHSSITYKLKLNGGDMKSVQGDSGHAQVKMVADVYSHIIDDDRRLNAERLEAAFYSGRQVTPEPVQAVTQESSTDDKELLLKLLQNPEMAALLKSLAKTL